MEITLMGTASAASGAGCDNTYLLVRNDDDCTMVDVGGNPLGKLKQLQLSSHQIKRVIFTHLHIDHIYGLPSLLWGMWLDQRTEPLDIYCDEGERDWMEQWLDHLKVMQWAIRFEIHVVTYTWKKPSVIAEGEDWTMSVFPSRHSVPTVGVKMIHEGKVMVYSSDTMLNPEIKGLPIIDLLIHEATTAHKKLESHTSLEELAGFYNWSAVERVTLVHMTDNEPYGEILGQLPEEIRRKITLGQELTTVTL